MKLVINTNPIGMNRAIHHAVITESHIISNYMAALFTVHRAGNVHTGKNKDGKVMFVFHGAFEGYLTITPRFYEEFISVAEYLGYEVEKVAVSVEPLNARSDIKNIKDSLLAEGKQDLLSISMIR